ncbi:MAG: tRNA-dihydrouridine synthase, partial [Spirochaetaceae bacterium]|nr:tRNA-dihydrouridine synthase [Spirochaetaceae bacterium]
VATLAAELPVPVIGNGDVRSFADYSLKKDLWRPAGVMIGRAAARAPWFFAFLRGKEEDPAGELRVDLAETAGKFLELLPLCQPADFLASRAKRFFSWFCNNLTFGHGLVVTIQNSEGFAEIEKAVLGYFPKHPEERYKVEKN